MGWQVETRGLNFSEFAMEWVEREIERRKEREREREFDWRERDREREKHRVENGETMSFTKAERVRSMGGGGMAPKLKSFLSTGWSGGGMLG